MKAIIDTSGWYAFISQSDKYHSRAKAIVQELKNPIVPYPVFEELTALSHKRLGKIHTLEYIGRFLTSKSAIIYYLNPKDNRQIWELYKAKPNWLDYVDSSVIWLSRKLNLSIFTFDRHFKTLDLPLIP